MVDISEPSNALPADDALLEQLRIALTTNYTVERRVGEGMLGIVFRVVDDGGRPAVAKVLRPELVRAVGSDVALRELGVAARLNHPNILPILSVAESAGLVYFITPFVEGTSLRRRIDEEGPLPPADAMRIALEVADAASYAHRHRVLHRDINPANLLLEDGTADDVGRVTTDVAAALDYAHRKGVIHRDVKPENILLYEGQALLADFGIALALDRAGTRLSHDGSPGTPLYMSPEQIWFPERMDYRSDIYSLGCVVYEMITGQPPFVGGFQMVAASHLHAPVPHARAKRREISDELDLAVCKALSKEPEQRFQSVLGFANAVGDAARSTSGHRTEPTASRMTGIGDGPSTSTG